MDRDEEIRQLKVNLSVKTNIIERVEADLLDMFEIPEREAEKVAKAVATKEEQSVPALANEMKRAKLVTDRLESERHDKNAALTDEAIAMKKAILAASESASQCNEMSEKASEHLAASVSVKARITAVEKECEESSLNNDELSRQNAEFLSQKAELQSEALVNNSLIQDLQKQANVSTDESRNDKFQLLEANKTLKAKDEEIQELKTQAETMVAANEADKTRDGLGIKMSAEANKKTGGMLSGIFGSTGESQKIVGLEATVESLWISSEEKQVEKVARSKKMQQLESKLLTSQTTSNGLLNEAEVLRSSLDGLRTEVGLKTEESDKLKQEQEQMRSEMVSMKLNAADLQDRLDNTIATEPLDLDGERALPTKIIND